MYAYFGFLKSELQDIYNLLYLFNVLFFLCFKHSTLNYNLDLIEYCNDEADYGNTPLQLLDNSFNLINPTIIIDCTY